MRRTPHHLIVYFHYLFNEPINMQTFEDRLLLQKRVYFLQEFGIPFGYSFGWYVRGPYSSELARDGFESEPISKLFHEKWQDLSNSLPGIEGSDKEALEKARAFFNKIRESGLSEERFLELASSLHFLKNTWFPGDYFKAAELLRKLKPKFSISEIEVARELLEKYL